MKKIGVLRLGLAFGGCFLGAGYVSGQEMWQFFGQYGVAGYFGIVLAVALLCVIGAVTLLLTKKLGTTETDRLIIDGDHPLLRRLVFWLEAAFLFCVCIVMTAGVGALGETVFRVPVWLGCAVFTVIVTLISFAGFSGLLAAFSATVPILVAVTLFFGIRSAAGGAIIAPQAAEVGARPSLLSLWPLAAILFTCYNVFGSIAILAPLGPAVEKRGTVIRGILVGAMILLATAFSVLISVSAAGTQAEELPMLSMALEQSRFLGLVYAVLLLLAMFGTCLSCLVAFVRTVSDKWKNFPKFRIPFHLVCALIIFVCSLFGFGDLIGVIYPFFGYCSSVFIILLMVHFFKVRKTA